VELTSPRAYHPVGLAARTTPPAPAGRLRRILGVGFGLGVSVGGTIGVGILRAPGAIAAGLSGRSASWLTIGRRGKVRYAATVVVPRVPLLS